MSTPATPVLDFSRVQYEGDAAPLPPGCAYCTRGLEDGYYRVNGDTVCGNCAEQVRAKFPADTHKAFVHALLWGIPAAVLGMAIFAGFEIVTGISIGYLAIGVGYLVAKALLRGSGGVRGRRYQWTAVLLTYAAVAMAFIPIAVAAELHVNGAKVKVVGSDSAKKEGASAKASDTSEQHGFLYGAALILGFGLISPFYELAMSFGSGLIGLLILFWGMQAAWKLMAAPKVVVDGPFGVV